jgi:hypothetical protein
VGLNGINTVLATEKVEEALEIECTLTDRKMLV